MLEIRTFGGLQLTTGGESITGLASRKAEALLVYLAVTGRPQSREVLADFFWDERSQTQAMANLRTVLSSLRQNIGEYLEISRDYAAISPEAAVWLDLQEFENQLGTARLQEALSLYQGEFLEGFNIRDSRGFEDWLLHERQRCQERLQQGLYAWVRYHIERGSCQEGIIFAEQLLVIDPLDEVAFRQLMVLLALTGQQATLARRYEEFCQHLKSELGVEPFQETQDLYRDLLAGHLSQIAGVRGMDARQPRAVGECPYRGLAHFREVDAPFFFGREAFTDQLAAAVQNDSVVTVIVGASGSGKSSTVYAGLLPRLRRQGNWQVVTLRPGRHPFERLAAALLPMLESNLDESARLEKTGKLVFDFQHTPGALKQHLETLQANGEENQRILLLIDQFEELYTLCQQTEVRHRFLDALLSVVNGCPDQHTNGVVLLQTLRADFMGQALAYRPFADTMQKAALMLGPMTRDELCSVIVNPAEKQGAAFEPGLVERILDDVGEEPGNLPLLEFALTLLWERLDHGWFTHAVYEEIGGVAGALTRYAEEVYASMTQDQQDQLRKIFVQLVQPGEGAEDTRRVASREELAGSDWDLVRQLADRRLVVTNVDSEGTQTVEVVHEALIRSWDRLGQWMEEDRAFRSWQEGLRTDIRHWQEHEQDEGDLLRGRSLAQAEGWLAERPAELSESAQRFILASIELRDRRERERAMRRRRIFAGLAAGLVITLILAGVAFHQRNESLKAYSMSLAAHVQNAIDQNRTDTALALAMEANQISNPPAEVQRVLRQAAYAPGPVERLSVMDALGHEGQIYSLEISPSEMVALMGMNDGTVFLWDIETEQVIFRLEGHTDVVQDIVFSPDGKTALSASHDGLVIYWDLQKGEQTHQFEGHTGWVRAVAFSPDGQTFASGGYSGTTETSIIDPGELFLWDLETGEVIHRFEGHPTGVVAVDFTPDGHSILASSGLFIDLQNTYSMILWDVETGEVIHDFDIEYDNFNIAISPDGRIAISGDYLYNVNIWDLEAGSLIQTLPGHEGMVRSVTFTPDGDKALTSDSVGMLILWDTNSWEKLMQSKIHQAGGQGWSRYVPWVNIAISPDGQTALSSAEDKTLVIWNLVGAYEIRRFVGHEDMVFSVAITPDGEYALTGTGSMSTFAGVPGEYNNIHLWDIGTGELLDVFEGHTDAIFMIVVSEDGTKALSGALDGTIRLWNLETKSLIRTIQAHSGGVFSVAISPDGKTALSGSMSNSLFPDDGVRIWDLETGQLLHHVALESNSTSLLFNSDGLSAFIDGYGLNLLDISTGQIVEHFSAYQFCCTGFVLMQGENSVYSVTNTDTLINEWNLETDEIVRTIGSPHGGNRTRLEITPNGERLFSSGVFGNLYLWDLPSGEELYHFSSGELTIDIDINPDGTRGLSPGSNNTAILWNLDLPIELNEVREWIVENRIVRELTCEERATYSIEPLCEGELAASP